MRHAEKLQCVTWLIFIHFAHFFVIRLWIFLRFERIFRIKLRLNSCKHIMHTSQTHRTHPHA